MAFINSNFLAGLILFVASLFLIPPARDFAYKKTSKEISAIRRGLIVSVLFIGFGITVGGQGKNISVSEDGKTGSLAAIADEKRKADEAEKVRLAALTPSLTMKCENQKGWLVYIMHLNTQATVIKPVENPVDGYRAVAENVTIKNYGKPEYWYSPEDLNKGFNITKTSYWRGFTQAKLDLRETILGKSKEPRFTIFSDVYNTFKKEWETSYSGKYICSNISLAAFNAVLLNNKK